MLVCMHVCVSVSSSLHSFLFAQQLRGADNSLVNILNVHIKSGNMQVELIRFRKKNVFNLFTFTFANKNRNKPLQFGPIF